MKNTTQEAKIQAVTGASDILGEFIRISASLIVVLVVMFVMLYVFKRFTQISQSQYGYLKIVDSLTIGTKERIMLLQVGEEQVLVSTSGGEIKLLYNLIDPLEITKEKNDSKHFYDKFQQILTRGKLR